MSGQQYPGYPPTGAGGAPVVRFEIALSAEMRALIEKCIDALVLLAKSAASGAGGDRGKTTLDVAAIGASAVVADEDGPLKRGGWAFPGKWLTAERYEYLRANWPAEVPFKAIRDGLAAIGDRPLPTDQTIRNTAAKLGLNRPASMDPFSARRAEKPVPVASKPVPAPVAKPAPPPAAKRAAAPVAKPAPVPVAYRPPAPVVKPAAADVVPARWPSEDALAQTPAVKPASAVATAPAPLAKKPVSVAPPAPAPAPSNGAKPNRLDIIRQVAASANAKPAAPAGAPTVASKEAIRQWGEARGIRGAFDLAAINAKARSLGHPGFVLKGGQSR